MSSLPEFHSHCAAHCGFTAQARRTPRAIALLCGTQSQSYGELERHSSRLARYLHIKKVKSGDIVCVALKPSFDWVIAILGIWKAGAVYLPLDTSYPAERLQLMIDAAQSKLVLTLSTLGELFAHTSAVLVNVDAEREWIHEQSSRPVSLRPGHGDPDALAYLMYTSGSTGTPKGVMVSHRALVNKLTQPGTWGHITAQCRSALLTSIAFDASLAQLFLPLMQGGSVVLIEEHNRLDPQVWSLLQRAQVNLLDCTPSWLLTMLDAAIELPLARVVVGGEVLTPALARRIRSRFPTACITNIYGPTETCIDALAYEVNDADLQSELIPIGRPLPGYEAYLLDANLQPVAQSEVGELYIGGVGVAQGYWGNASASAARFIANPFAPGRLYATGDLGRRRADGCIEFLGRADHQIKLRGQRLELGEIETALARLPEVVAAVVKAWPRRNSDDLMLVAYVVPRHPGLLAAQFREQLAQRLPRFMLPSEFVLLERLPVLANGKVDRAALPPVVEQRVLDAQALPRDAIEQELASIWCEVLQLEQVGVHDNFFTLGGDSLSVVRLLMLINARFHTRLLLPTLLANLNIADLAIALASRLSGHQPSRVLRLTQPVPGQPPLFMLPPITGIGLVYAGVARELSDAVAIIALQAVGFGETSPGKVSMPQLVSEFVREIQRFQPYGPVRLGAYSAGGVVTHELTRQLLVAGREVSHLFLFDPFSAGMSAALLNLYERNADPFHLACRDLIWDAMGIRGEAAQPMVQLAQRMWLSIQAANSWQLPAAILSPLTRDAQAVLPDNMNMEIFMMLMEGLVTLWHAFESHSLTPLQGFTGTVYVMQPDNEGSELREARNAEWRALFGTAIQTTLVPGQHATLLNRAHTVGAISAQIRRALQVGAAS